ncbi:MAG TPA: peptide deformylase [Polyangia bacterium]|jgi:peptide deformylase
MAIVRIVKYPEPELRLVSADIPVDQIATPAVRELVADMTDTMYAHNGAGLAAIQIARPERLLIIDGKIAGGTEQDPPVPFINPTIEWLSDETDTRDEGCLSFPGIFVPVKRALKARVSAYNLKGERFVVEAEEMYARALQHEHDHLTGRLIVDFVGAVKREIIKRKMRRVAREEAEEAAEEAAAAPEAVSSRAL